MQKRLYHKIRKNPPTLENRLLKLFDGKKSTHEIAERTNVDLYKVINIANNLFQKGKLKKVKEILVYRTFYVVFNNIKCHENN